MKKRALLPAVSLIMAALLLLSGASYAWFSMNSAVTANTMNVSVSSPSNLLISTDEDGAYDIAGTVTSAGVSLRPVSSATGIDFFTWTEGSLAEDGSMLDPQVTSTPTLFEAVDDTDHSGYYEDFTFWLKCTEGIDLKLNGVSVTRGASSGQDLSLALRFVILNGSNVSGIYVGRDVSAAYFAAGRLGYITGHGVAIGSIGTGDDQGQPWLDPITPLVVNDALGVAFHLTPNTPFQITIRVWIEGEDNTCFYNYANPVKSTDTYNLSISLTKVA